jgi:hypothetical protein
MKYKSALPICAKSAVFQFAEAAIIDSAVSGFNETELAARR